MIARQANQGCWTCKKRKIGCDKGLPSCNNCVRTGRECMGYGLRLVWPDIPDGRRKSPKLSLQHSHGQLQASGLYYGEQFLNISFDDIEQNRQDVSTLTLQDHHARPQQALTLHPDLMGHESDLLSYYERKIARMISTVDANNGFRLQLLPIAMSGSNFAARGLRSAILALSAFHRHGSGAALPYKIQALRLLSHSLEKESYVDVPIESQLAASMMLCVYNVFDEGEGKWHLHLNGSRSLLHRYAEMRGGTLDYDFLNTWFLYHEILGCFSQPHKHNYEGASSLDLLQGSDCDKTVIIGSLGCSVEIMEIIHHINQLRYPAGQKFHDKVGRSELPSVMWTCQGLQDRLSRLKQQLPPEYAIHSIRERTKVQVTAELYRIAAVLYLRAVCPNIDATNQTPLWLEEGFRLLSSLEICTSPWPLFVIACESQVDDQRITILRTLDRMDADRKIGNVFVLRNLIEKYWKQQDLQADGDRAKPLKWWELMSFDTAAPWFI
ncbi:n-terminal fungal transcription regulatory domain-containing protein [Diaporthe amygdali]|uniref:n-terminal fungal transcription regulatory domain-containing protein n=1 Tax=Phomopsis amygdali TaxID=1214568 RepID=UPI0022FF317E|nr:n-terminal fungal transcription regulatory domain-containing protein [Diaporthe amygdali]KAJ0116865.1 n-terminal fungal transcription regulatory domain-containing protein [Diaporthe amygdali]